MSYIQRIRHTIAPLGKYVDGVIAMRAAGTYHKYVWWHDTMHNHVDPSDSLGIRNPGHRGPSFLPWHREFLRRLEKDLQNALSDATFGIPYWHWAIDKTNGELSSSRVWTEVGSNTGLLSLKGSTWSRMSAQLVGGTYTPIDLPQVVLRQWDSFSNPGFGHIANIPDDGMASAFVADTSQPYDTAPWNRDSSGFRRTNERSYHDHIHVLIGGDDGDMSRPRIAVNDPIFFLHHGMVDRLWAHWQDAMVAAGVSLDDTYHPTMTEASGILTGHRIDEPMWPWSDSTEMGRWGLPAEEVTPRMVLNIRDDRQNYVYDDSEPEGCLPTAGRILIELIRSIGGRRG